MKTKIQQLLNHTPGLKGREIAKFLALERAVVNSFLDKNRASFIQDENFRWFNRSESEIRIHLEGKPWLDGLMFDLAVRDSGSPLESDCQSVIFVVAEGAKIFLEAAARLLALSNQCAHRGKSITIDFNASEETLTYLDRIGFLDFLDSRVEVKPGRSLISRASIYHGNSDAVYEFAEIDNVNPDEKIPQRLKDSFVRLVEEALGQPGCGVAYVDPAFTVLSELFGNVGDHSDSPIPGYIALQRYKGYRGKNSVGPHIQTIVSDSGKGIVGTLRPVLENKYPALFKQLDFDDPSSGPRLVRAVFEKGQISQFPDQARGLGLRRSAIIASKHHVKVSVREGKFEVQMVFEEGNLAKFSYEPDLPFMLGTHICFDFYLQITH